MQMSSRLPEALLLASKFNKELLSFESLPPLDLIGSIGGPESVLIKESLLELEGDLELFGVEAVKYMPWFLLVLSVIMSLVWSSSLTCSIVVLSLEKL